MELIYWLLMIMNLVVGMFVFVNKHKSIGWFQALMSIAIPIVTLVFFSQKEYFAFAGPNVDFFFQCIREGNSYARLILMLYIALLVLAAVNVCSLYNSEDHAQNV